MKLKSTYIIVLALLMTLTTSYAAKSPHKKPLQFSQEQIKAIKEFRKQKNFSTGPKTGPNKQQIYLQTIAMTTEETIDSKKLNKLLASYFDTKQKLMRERIITRNYIYNNIATTEQKKLIEQRLQQSKTQANNKPKSR
jgi:Spy/CpxP family protein refolding chaperone